MPDGRGGYGGEGRTKVYQAIAKAYASLIDRSACNEFVKSVVKEATGRELLSGNANDIYEQILRSPWTLIGKGESGSKIAGVTAAHEGKLVVAAWSNSSGHGHCAIVVDLTNSKHPTSSNSEKGIRALLQGRAVIAAGRLNHPEKAGTYGKITDSGNGYGSDKLRDTIFSSIDVA